MAPASDEEFLRRLRPLDPHASTPLWRQLKQALRDLATFDLRAGDRIPSEARIGRHFGLSRVTVRQAISSLVDSGHLQRQQGRGTYVRRRRSAEPLADAEHFLASAFDAATPDAVQLYSAELINADQWVADHLRIRPGDLLQKIRKVLRHGDQSVAYRVTWVPASRCPALLDCDLNRPLHQLYEEGYGLVAASADEAIELVYADEFRAQVLQTPVKDPLIVVQRLVYANSGDPIEFSRAYYRADHFQLRRQLTRGQPSGAPAALFVGNGRRYLQPARI